MEFPELIADFAARHNVEGMTAEDGAAAIDIDGIVVVLTSAGDRLDATAEIGDPPAEGAAVFANLLLEAGMESEAFFVKDRETGRYLLRRRLYLPQLAPDTFDTALENLVNLAETWRRLLADFRPAAKAAAENTPPPAFGAGTFMQV